MSATNANIVRNAIAKYRIMIFDEVEIRCRKFCAELCQSAITYRKSNPRAHNFTGNLLNSIVVCLYRLGSPIYACYAADRTTKAIQVKMTHPKSYFFKGDYDGKSSRYHPTVVTDEGWGEDDARQFFQSYRPEGKNLFDIVVAYPTEYGEWVEMKRSSTGIMQTYAHAEQVGVSYLKLVRK